MTQKWLLVSGDFVPTGGMDAALLGLARYLASRGPVEIVAHRVAPTLVSLRDLVFHKVSRPAGSHLFGQPILAWIGRRRAVALSSIGARVVCNGGNCAGDDINWVHYVHAAYTPRTTVVGLRSVKTAMTHALNCWTERRTIPNSPFVVCNSRRTASDVQRAFRIPAERTRVVYYGCDAAALGEITAEERAAARFTLDQHKMDRPWLLFVGALGDIRKGFDTLYASWKRLVQEEGWGALLWIVGTGAEVPVWEARARADGIAQSLRFLGFRDDVPQLLAAMDLMVHPARYEAYGLGVHEALCRGVPAIVSRSAGIAERFPGELDALLLNDAESSSELTDRLLAWRGDCDAFSAAARQFGSALRQRSWDDMAAEFVLVTQEDGGSDFPITAASDA